MAAPRCVFCSGQLPAAQLAAGGGHVHCTNCGKESVILALPELLDDSSRRPPPAFEPAADGEAACFYTPQRRATKECSHCGVLISDVWAAQWGSKVMCLKCLEHLNAKSTDVGFQTGRTLWDNIALALALIPFTLILWPLGFMTAPAAVLLGLWHWNSPRSLVSGGRLRLVLAVGIGLVEVGFVALPFALAMTSHSSGHH